MVAVLCIVGMLQATGEVTRVSLQQEIEAAWALGAHRPALTFDLFGTGEIAGCLEGGKDRP